MLKRISRILWISALVFILCCGCDSKKVSKVVIATNSNHTKAILNLIRHEKLLEKYLPDGIKIEYTEVSGFENARDALISGDVHFVSMPGTSFIIAKEQGYPLELVSNSMGENVYIYSNNDKIKSINDIDLANKIAIHGLGSSHYIGLQQLAGRYYNNYNYFDDRLVIMEFPDILTSIRTSKEIDVAILPFPFSEQTKEIKNLKKIYEFSRKDFELGNYIFTSENFSKNNQEIMNAFRKAEVDAINMMIKTPDNAAKILAPLYEIDAKLVGKNLMDYPPYLEIDNYNETANLLYKIGMLEKKPKDFKELSNYGKVPKNEKSN